MKNNYKNTLILLTVILAVTCTITYDRIQKIKKENQPNIEENDNQQNKEQTITKNLTDEEIKKIIVDTYLKKTGSQITNYRFESISLDSNTEELKKELNYQKTDILAFVKYEVQKNNEEEWQTQNQNCFILRKGEDGKYFVYKAGSGW